MYRVRNECQECIELGMKMCVEEMEWKGSWRVEGI